MMASADTRGRAEARVTLPDLPEDCRKREPHRIRAGDEAITALKRERRALDRANARVGRCATFYDDTKTRLQRDPQQQDQTGSQ